MRRGAAIARHKFARWWLPVGVVLAALALVAWRVLRALTLAAASGSLAGLQLIHPCSGYYERDTKPPPPKHPFARMTDITVTPSNVLKPGQAIRVTAKTNCSPLFAVPYVCYGPEDHYQTAGLRDDGRSGDGGALDGVWAVELPWDPRWLKEYYIAVYVELGMHGLYSLEGGTINELYIMAGQPGQIKDPAEAR
jgi:hypothetical protein